MEPMEERKIAACLRTLPDQMIENESLSFKKLEHFRIKKVEHLFGTCSRSLFYRIFLTRTGFHFAENALKQPPALLLRIMSKASSPS
jgi:hypothetical protein